MSDWKLADTYDTGDGLVRWGAFGEGDPVILLHGTPFSSYIWRDVVQGLSANHRVYVWDMLGFGQSDKHDGQDVSLARQTRLFCDLLELWDVRRPSVIAHDVGGVVALRATLIEDVAFGDLTLIDAASISGWGAGGFFQTIRENPHVFLQLPDWASDALIESKIRTGSHPGLRPEALKTYLDSWCSPEGRGAFYRQYAQGGEEHTDALQDRLASLSMPVRILWGREDQWLTLDYAERLRAALPQAEFAIIDGAGHMVPEDSPGALLRHLVA
jgi:pimeloyl-ACP methyl ester carboxylesterase